MKILERLVKLLERVLGRTKPPRDRRALAVADLARRAHHEAARFERLRNPAVVEIRRLNGIAHRPTRRVR